MTIQNGIAIGLVVVIIGGLIFMKVKNKNKNK